MLKNNNVKIMLVGFVMFVLGIGSCVIYDQTIVRPEFEKDIIKMANDVFIDGYIQGAKDTDYLSDGPVILEMLSEKHGKEFVENKEIFNREYKYLDCENCYRYTVTDDGCIMLGSLNLAEVIGD